VVNGTEPSPSVRIPCFSLGLKTAANGNWNEKGGIIFSAAKVEFLSSAEKGHTDGKNESKWERERERERERGES
jgi:hypothetical protein